MCIRDRGYYFLMPSSWLETVTGALEAGERQFIFSEWVVNDEGVGASCAVILKIGVFTKANWDAHITCLLYTSCCLIPGLPGVSENITVYSIVGQLLEHSRIFKFENAGNPKIYMGSADWMPRNLDRRVELVFPIDDQDLKERAFGILELMLSDTVNARIQQPDTTYAHIDKRLSLIHI